MSGNRNVSVCRGHELANALYNDTIHFPHKKTIFKKDKRRALEGIEQTEVAVKIKINEHKFVNSFDGTFLRENYTMAAFNDQMFHVFISCALDVV